MNGKSLASLFVRLALVVGLAAPALVLAGAAGTKFGLIDYRLGFMTLANQWGALVAMAGPRPGVVALLVSLSDFRRFGVMALIGLLAAGATLAGLWRYKSLAAASPPIHDVSTNWEDPVGFSKITLADRGQAENGVEPDPRVDSKAPPPWGGQRVADINAQTCPGAKSIPHAVDVEVVAKALEDNGVQVTAKQAPFRVEGTAESFWFGFKDDVAVRIRPERTDIRSTSRVGQSDLGANCRRVTRIVQALGK